jgi:Flp pilus assembly pilin Flp
MSEMKNELKDIDNSVDVNAEKKKDQGATMVEYALLAALIAVALIAVITYLSRSVSNTFSTVGSAIQ